MTDGEKLTQYEIFVERLEAKYLPAIMKALAHPLNLDEKTIAEIHVESVSTVVGILRQDLEKLRTVVTEK